MKRRNLRPGDVFRVPKQFFGDDSLYIGLPMTVVDQRTEVDEHRCVWAFGDANPDMDVVVVR